MNFEQYFFIFKEDCNLSLTPVLIEHLKTFKLIIAFRFEDDRTVLSKTKYYSNLDELQEFYKQNKEFLKIIDTRKNIISFENIVTEIKEFQQRELTEIQNRRKGILPPKYQDLTLEKIEKMQEENRNNFGFINSVSDFAKVGNDIRREFSSSSLQVPFEIEKGKIVVMDKYFIKITFEDFLNKYNILKTDTLDEVFKKMNIKYTLQNFEKISCIFEKKEDYVDYIVDTVIKKDECNSIKFEKKLLKHLGWYVIFVDNQNLKSITVSNDIFNFWKKVSVVDEFYDLLLEFLDKYKNML